MGDGPDPARLFPTHPSIFPKIRTFLRQQATEAGLGQETADDLVLAVCEACANTLRHTLSPHIMLTWRARPQSVEVLVEDEGIFRSRAAVFDADGASTGAGMGIPLMVALTDEFAIKQGTEEFPGTLVRLVKYLH
jgi:anti-sigma regulatory factor (Ser/Thr protein kinase)